MAERKPIALSVEYEMGAAAVEGKETLSAQAQDICANGIKILTDHRLQRGAVLKLNIPVRGLSTQLPVFAEVAWTADTDDRFRAGLRFLR